MSHADSSPLLSKLQKHSGVMAGVHLAGANARKSAVVLLEYAGQQSSFLGLYEKIGSSGSLFSDERILNILTSEKKLQDVFVDCPITEPPCVACTRPTCPGVVRCDDVSVAMMLAVESQRKRKGAHKLRPLNPQNQRLWDIMYTRSGAVGNFEPSYSANLAPLVVRARTLQRRLRAVFPNMSLRETNVSILLSQLTEILDGPDWEASYRNFERGVATRRDVLGKLSRAMTSDLRIDISEDALQAIAASVETFHAFMAAAMGIWRRFGIARAPTGFFETSPGWVDTIEATRII